MNNYSERQYREKLGCVYCYNGISIDASPTLLICTKKALSTIHRTDCCLDFTLDEKKWKKYEEKRLENKTW